MNKFLDFIYKKTPFHTIGILKQQVDTLLNALRPFTSDARTQGTEPIPEYPYRPEMLYTLSKYSDTLTIVQTKIRDEIFRNGIELLEADKTDSETTTSEDETSAELGERKSILEKIEDCNENHQSLIEVAKEMEDDLNVIDDAYGLFLNEYEYNEDGMIIGRTFKEFISASPLYMKPVMNRQYRYGFNDDGEEIRFCPEHRDVEHKEAKTDKCRTCGKKLVRASFKFNNSDKSTYYMWDEVVHVSKYRPSKALGFSPVMTVWQKTKTLIAQDTYMLETYEGKRSPKQMVVFNTPNRDSLKAAWDDMLERVKNNPHQPAILGLDQGIGGNKKDTAQMFEFMRSLEEMQFSETRKELRQQIGAVFGVEPVFQGDISVSGGLNNEGLQITVTNRAAEVGQSIYNDKVFPRFLKAMDVDGWVLKLKEVEEQDEMAKLERQQLSLQNGQAASQLGLEAEYDPDTMEVVIKQGPIKAGGMMGSMGMGGMMNSFGPGPSQPSPTATASPGDSQEPKHTINPPKAPKHTINPEKTSQGEPDKPKHTINLKKSEVKKVDVRPPFTMLSTRIKREISKILKVFKTKPSEKELRKIKDRLKTSLQQELQLAVDRSLDQTYKQGKESVEKEIGINLSFGEVDKNTLSTLKNQRVLYESYAGLTKELVDKTNDVIAAAYHGTKSPTVKTITDQLKNNLEFADARAENIARTESAKVMSAARRNAYLQDDPSDNSSYVWIGPEDYRTTDTSKRITKRVGNGVSWGELLKIVMEESAKDFPKWTVDKNFPVSHYQSRHTFLRVNR